MAINLFLRNLNSKSEAHKQIDKLILLGFNPLWLLPANSNPILFTLKALVHKELKNYHHEHESFPAKRFIKI